MATKKLKPVESIRLDIGCGKNKKEGFLGVDQFKMAGVDVVMDVRKTWPWADNSVDEVHCAHFIEHLTNLGDKWERVHFFNELHRVMKVGATCTLILPHWASTRFYGDPTHKEPFSEMAFYYLDPKWRESDAPHTDIKWNKNGYKCNFECVWGYGLHQSLLTRNQEYQQFAIANYKEAATDIHATLKKR